MSSEAALIRRATVADIPAGIEMVRKCYPDRPIDNAAHWVKWLIGHPDRCVLIGLHSVGCAEFTWRYGFEPRARLGFLAASPVAYAVLEPLRMVRVMVEWAKSKGAKGCFRLDADTGVDFGPFAKRLGGYEHVMRGWDIPLEQ